jgi:Na+/glutamate symporter
MPPAIFREAFVLKLNLVHTVAFSGIVRFAGYGLRKFIKPLARYNIPAPAVGGLVVAMFGAFFTDFTKALIITVFLNIFN